MRARWRVLACGAVVAIGAAIVPAAPAVAQPPLNDDFDSAVVVMNGYRATLDTSEATTAPDDPGCRRDPPVRTVWYSLTATVDSAVTLDATPAAGSSYQPAICRYTGPRGGLTFEGFGGTLMNFSARAGTAYRIMVAVDPDSGPGNILGLAVTEVPVRHVTFSGLDVWLGVKSEGSLGLRVDLQADVYDGSSIEFQGYLNNVDAGSTSFTGAQRQTVPSISGSRTIDVPVGDPFGVILRVRNSCEAAKHMSGTARFWYGNKAADSRLTVTVDGVPMYLYLQPDFSLRPTPGTGTKAKTDVPAGARCSEYKTVGRWEMTVT